MNWNIFVSCMVVALVMSIRGTVAQDLIVTNDGDSLNVNITRVGSGFYEWKEKRGGQVYVLRMESRDVFAVYRGYYIGDRPVQGMPMSAVSKGLPRVRLGLSVGYSLLLSRVNPSVPASLRPHVEKLRHGYNVRAELAYFPWNHFGFGLDYGFYGTTARTAHASFYNHLSSAWYSGLIYDNVKSHFIGAGLQSRHRAGGGTFLHYAITMGYVSYLNDAYAGRDLRISGSTFGMNYRLGLEFDVGSNVSLGLSFIYAFAVLSELEINDGLYSRNVQLQGDNKESLGRLEFGVALRWQQ